MIVGGPVKERQSAIDQRRGAAAAIDNRASQPPRPLALGASTASLVNAVSNASSVAMPQPRSSAAGAARSVTSGVYRLHLIISGAAAANVAASFQRQL